MWETSEADNAGAHGPVVLRVHKTTAPRSPLEPFQCSPHEGHRLQPDHLHFNTITRLHTHIPRLNNTTTMLSSDITIISTFICNFFHLSSFYIQRTWSLFSAKVLRNSLWSPIKKRCTTPTFQEDYPPLTPLKFPDVVPAEESKLLICIVLPGQAWNCRSQPPKSSTPGLRKNKAQEIHGVAWYAYPAWLPSLQVTVLLLRYCRASKASSLLFSHCCTVTHCLSWSRILSTSMPIFLSSSRSIGMFIWFELSLALFDRCAWLLCDAPSPICSSKSSSVAEFRLAECDAFTDRAMHSATAARKDILLNLEMHKCYDQCSTEWRLHSVSLELSVMQSRTMHLSFVSPSENARSFCCAGSISDISVWQILLTLIYRIPFITFPLSSQYLGTYLLHLRCCRRCLSLIPDALSDVDSGEWNTFHGELSCTYPVRNFGDI